MSDFFFQLLLFLVGLILEVCVGLLSRADQKLILILLGILCISVSVIWTGFEVSNAANQDVECINSEDVFITVEKDVLMVDETSEVSLHFRNINERLFVYDWWAEFGEMNPGLRSNSVTSLYTAQEVIDDTVHLKLTAPGCGAILLTKPISVVYRNIVSTSEEHESWSYLFAAPIGGFMFQEIEAGVGPQPKQGSTVSVHYRALLADGTLVDDSYRRGQPFVYEFGVGKVIPGFDKGVAAMCVGGKSRIIVPAELAYSDQRIGLIPPNSTLIFEIQLVGVTPNESSELFDGVGSTNLPTCYSKP